MPKITFMGAGSTVFAKSVLGDCMLSPALRDAQIALYDVDRVRLRESKMMLDTLNANVNAGRATITAHLGVASRREALRGASYVVNAIQVGGYEPATVIDFEIPKKYGLRQTIGDTLGIGGIFRALRTIPVVLDFARDMEAVCPDALFLNYTNPMAMVTAGLLRGSGVRAVGLCHSVQVCADGILAQLGMAHLVRRLQWKIGGINHQAWLLEITDGGEDLYPEIKRRAAAKLEAARRKGGPKHHDMVRHYMMLNFGYYITESSEHCSEYLPYFIKSRFPELIEEFNIPLDEYPRRCVNQIRHWARQRDEIVRNRRLTHVRSHEYGSRIMEAMETDVPFKIGGNVMNADIITNLPAKACVEVPCLVDRSGVQPCHIGDLPEACAALNRTNINPQILAVEAALTGRRDFIYQAAMLDPHTAAELPIDQIRRLCDDLVEAHGKMLPRYTDAPAPRRPWSALVREKWRSPAVAAWQASKLVPKTGGPVAPASLRDSLGWRPLGASDTYMGFVNVHETYGDGDGIVYLANRFRVARAGTWRIRLGHDGGATVFVDGKQALAVPERVNPARPDRSSCAVRLDKGVHEVVVALDTDHGYGWGIYFSFEIPVEGRKAKGTPAFPRLVPVKGKG